MVDDADEMVTDADVDVLARIVALVIPRGDIEGLVAALSQQVAALRELDRLDLMDFEPATVFDPRWRD
jgi:hypothetical protein